MFNEATFREIFLPSDGRNISRNIASLNIFVNDVIDIFVNDVINLSYYGR